MIKIKTKDKVNKDCNLPNLLQKWAMAKEDIEDVIKKVALCFINNGEESNAPIFEEERGLRDRYALGAAAAKVLFEKYSDVYSEFYNEKEAQEYLAKLAYGILCMGLVYNYPLRETLITDKISPSLCDINYATKIKINESLIMNKCNNASNIAAFFFSGSPKKQTDLMLNIVNYKTQSHDEVSSLSSPNYSPHNYFPAHFPNVDQLGDEAKEG